MPYTHVIYPIYSFYQLLYFHEINRALTYVVKPEVDEPEVVIIYKHRQTDTNSLINSKTVQLIYSRTVCM